VRLRVVLSIALLLAGGAFVLDMSGSAPRTAGSDHIAPVAFVARIPGGQELCQPAMVLPGDAATMRVLLGSYGHGAPAMTARFISATGQVVAAGQVAAGKLEGLITVPLGHPRPAAVGGTLCLRTVGKTLVVLAGEAASGPGSELIDGHPQPGRIDVVYTRAGRENWWQLLPTLSERFGVGKTPLFGDWTLAFMAALLAGVWAATVRLLLREPT